MQLRKSSRTGMSTVQAVQPKNHSGQKNMYTLMIMSK